MSGRISRKYFLDIVSSNPIKWYYFEESEVPTAIQGLDTRAWYWQSRKIIAKWKPHKKHKTVIWNIVWTLQKNSTATIKIWMIWFQWPFEQLHVFVQIIFDVCLHMDLKQLSVLNRLKFCPIFLGPRQH